MSKWLISIVVNSIAIIVVAELFDSFIVDNYGTALLASLILTVLNMIVKPILIIFTLPITIFTLGLFLFVINAATLMLTQWIIGDSFIIEGFGMAILAAIIISILNTILQSVFRRAFS